MKKLVVLLIVFTTVFGRCGNEVEVLKVKDFGEINRNPASFEFLVQTTDLTIGMVGDILLHNPLYTYTDYNPSFASVKSRMMSIDFLLANQESLPGGVEFGLSGYPFFNSPKHIIRDLKNNGVDMLSIANNHTMDQQEIGLLKAIKHMKEYHMPYVGGYESLEDSETFRIVEVKKVRIGILGYTYGLNGQETPLGKEYMVSLIDSDKMISEIIALKELVDIIVVSVHWGNEYELQTSEMQIELSGMLANAGADIIFGHHPHVVQPYEKIGETSVFYSLGNFYSGQQFDSTNIGGIAQIPINKSDIAGRSFIQVGTPEFYPTAVIKDKDSKYIVVPLKDAYEIVGYDEKWVEKQIGLTYQ